MSKNIFSLLACVILLSGCASTAKKEVEFRAYKQDKVRVDQVVQGSLGNWENSPEVYDDPDRRPTRKIYIMEWTKDTDPLPELAFDVDEVQRRPLRSSDGSGTAENRSTTTTTTVSTRQASSPAARPASTEPKFNFPNFDVDDDSDDSVAGSGSTNFAANAPSTFEASSFIAYKVQKNDTLQKISKQFYGGFSKWPRIYEANKDIIKDPNFIKPGITIQIPME